MSHRLVPIYRVLLAAVLFISSGSAFAQNLDRLYDNVQGAPHLEMIRNAKSSIDIEIYSMKDSLIFNELKSAMGRGVRVRVVQEPNPVSDPCLVFEPLSRVDEPKCVEQKKFVAFVRSHQGQYVPFNKSLCGQQAQSGVCFQHGKMMLVDSALVLLSTGNFNPSSFCDAAENPSVCNRDFTVVSRDRGVVDAIQKVFEADLAQKRVDLPSIIRSGGRVTISPFSLDPLVAFMDSAKKTIQIQNQYLKNPDFNQALIRAAKRGVSVFVMVASACAFGRPDQNAIDTWNRIYTEFDAAGVHTKTFNASIPIGGRPGYLHSKAILIDGTRSWVGSVNGSTTSLTQNREYGIFTSDVQFSHDLGMIMYSDYVQKGAESWKESLKCKKDYTRPAPPDQN